MRARRLIGLVVCLVVLIAPGRIESRQAEVERMLPPFDFAWCAKFIVRDFFRVQPYEKVVLMGDPSYYPELTDAIRAELLEAKAVEVGTLLFDGREVYARRGRVRPRASDPEYRRRATAAMRRLYEDADIFLWLPYRYGLGQEPGDWRMLEHLVEGTNARGLHFHWIQSLESFSQQEIDQLSRMYAEALDIDYDALSAHQDRMIAAIKDNELHITTPSGTDLRVRVPADAWIHKGDGRMDRERAAAARSVRDREMELPAGAVRLIPDVGTTEGTLVVPEWAGGRDVRFDFRQGRVVAVRARQQDEKVREAWTHATGDKDRVAEMLIGMNPKLAAKGPGNRPPYYGYGAGVLRIALGDNWESGGSNRSSLEAWFWFTDATITAGTTTLVKDGRLVLP